MFTGNWPIGGVVYSAGKQETETMPRKNTQFINLAEQLAAHNEVVGSTMDSILENVLGSKVARMRSDWDEIQKMIEQLHELNGPRGNQAAHEFRPKSKLVNKPKARQNAPLA